MNGTPRGNRLQVGIFGRVNGGKSTLLNLLTGQETSIASPVAGTTTDLVEKAMELLPIGPVLFLDTPGAGDPTELAGLRMERLTRAMERADVALLVVESGKWGAYEEALAAHLKARRTPVIAVVNKCDLAVPSPQFLELLRATCGHVMRLNASDPQSRDTVLGELKALLAKVVPSDRVQPPLVSDLVRPGGLILLVVPIDLEAPKGRLILPQVQTIREILDRDATAVVVKENDLPATLRLLSRPPDLVVCDSQAVLQVVKDLPPDVLCTTFSILFARAKGDLDECARGAARIARLGRGSSILIAEACTHHAVEDDIGRVKIPRWLRLYAGADLDIGFVAGCSFPPALDAFDLVVHCGACTMNRTAMMSRIDSARAAQVAITNYGLAIAFVQGVIERVLEPFPSARAAFDEALDEERGGIDAERTA